MTRLTMSQLRATRNAVVVLRNPLNLILAASVRDWSCCANCIEWFDMADDSNRRYLRLAFRPDVRTTPHTVGCGRTLLG